MTEQERNEIGEFLKSKGLSNSVIRFALDKADQGERLRQLKDSEAAKRYQELQKFDPNPGNATLTEVGKVPEGYRYLEDTEPAEFPSKEEKYDKYHGCNCDWKTTLRHWGIEVPDDIIIKSETPEPIFKEDRVCNKNVSSQKASDPGVRPCISDEGVRPCIFDEIIQQMSDIHRRKNADYGDAAYKGYKEFGITYYIIQLHNKLSRLKSLTENNGKPQVNESIEDTLLDMANYAVLALEALKRDGQ